MSETGPSNVATLPSLESRPNGLDLRDGTGRSRPESKEGQCDPHYYYCVESPPLQTYSLVCFAECRTPYVFVELFRIDNHKMYIFLSSFLGEDNKVECTFYFTRHVRRITSTTVLNQTGRFQSGLSDDPVRDTSTTLEIYVSFQVTWGLWGKGSPRRPRTEWTLPFCLLLNREEGRGNQSPLKCPNTVGRGESGG